jgi:hypothetical protein
MVPIETPFTKCRVTTYQFMLKVQLCTFQSTQVCDNRKIRILSHVIANVLCMKSILNITMNAILTVNVKG